MRGATLYSTLQPCGMCTMASIWSKVSRVVYGAGRDDVHKMYFEARPHHTISFISDAYRDDISIEGGVLREKCAALYYRADDDKVSEDEQETSDPSSAAVAPRRGDAAITSGCLDLYYLLGWRRIDDPGA